MYTRSTRNGIEFVFNNLTVLIWLFIAKIAALQVNILDILVDGDENMSDMMCHNHFIHSWTSEGNCIHF